MPIDIDLHAGFHTMMDDGEVQELGDFELDGVTFPAAEIKLEFLDPGTTGEDGGGGKTCMGALLRSRVARPFRPR